MTSYFDHFAVVEIVNHYGTDLFLILLSVVVLYVITNNWVKIIPDRFQLVLEKLVVHWEGVISENLGLREFVLYAFVFFIFVDFWYKLIRVFYVSVSSENRYFYNLGFGLWNLIGCDSIWFL